MLTVEVHSDVASQREYMIRMAMEAKQKARLSTVGFSICSYVHEDITNPGITSLQRGFLRLVYTSDVSLEVTKYVGVLRNLELRIACQLVALTDYFPAKEMSSKEEL